MHPLFSEQISTTWTVIVIEVAANGLVSPRCQKCEAELTVHQPEETRPDQLLGTCSGCGAWHLIERARADFNLSCATKDRNTQVSVTCPHIIGLRCCSAHLRMS